MMPSGIHAGPPLVATALAIGEREASSGAEVIAAIATGYNILGALAGNTQPAFDRTLTLVMGSVGVAAVASKLMKLDHTQTASALAYAASMPLMVGRGCEEVTFGLVARNGILATFLGRQRAPSPLDRSAIDDVIEDAPAEMDPLEGPLGQGLYQTQWGYVPDDIRACVATLGTRFDILDAMLKRFPCSGGHLVPVQLLQEIMRDEALTATDVAAVTVRRPTGTLELPRYQNYGPFASMYRAAPSLPFAMAATLVDGDVLAERFDNPNEPAMRDAIERVHLVFEGDRPRGSAVVEVRTADGRHVSREGDPSILTPPDPAPLLERYATPFVGRRGVDELLERATTLETVADVGALARGLRAAV